MLDYIEFLGMPTVVGIVIVAFFMISQVVGELLELKGKIVPEFLKVRKYFKRKKQEREMLLSFPQMLSEMKGTINDFNSHYSKDNITMRNEWIKNVNNKFSEYDELMRTLSEKLDKNNSDTLSLVIDNKRNSIINFASQVIDNKIPVTREQFNRIFHMYEDYEAIISANGLTNGEVDIAFRIIKESYEEHMRNHTFVEDLRGYTVDG